jgi:hypothetical protein
VSNARIRTAPYMEQKKTSSKDTSRWHTRWHALYNQCSQSECGSPKVEWRRSQTQQHGNDAQEAGHHDAPDAALLSRVSCDCTRWHIASSVATNPCDPRSSGDVAAAECTIGRNESSSATCRATHQQTPCETGQVSRLRRNAQRGLACCDRDERDDDWGDETKWEDVDVDVELQRRGGEREK